ncbi:excisionase [Rheinheimera salexigens]|uniref:excisionase n=1 Tax=Rheinheimera salexigens TaxID=1628148 RepID=UPI00114CB68B|nr:excisionase [Rheinheimera salexigens]
MKIGNNSFEQYGVRWVTLDKCAELVGYTKDALNALRVKGKLRMDIHWRKREGRIFIDMHAFQHWIETGK